MLSFNCPGFLPAGRVFVGDGGDKLLLSVGQVGVARNIFDGRDGGGDIAAAQRTDNCADVALCAGQRGEVLLHGVGGGEIANLFGEAELFGVSLAAEATLKAEVNASESMPPVSDLSVLSRSTS